MVGFDVPSYVKVYSRICIFVVLGINIILHNLKRKPFQKKGSGSATISLKLLDP